VDPFTLSPDGADLYVGGDFVTFQDEYLVRTARWDGSAFHALGQGVRDGSVRAIVVDGNRVYAGGDFTLTGNNYPTGNAAYFDGDWHTLGNGFYDGRVRDLELHEGVVFAGDHGWRLFNISPPGTAAWLACPRSGLLRSTGMYAMISSPWLYATGDFDCGGAAANHIAVTQPALVSLGADSTRG
jgi:hypothetical protein